MCLCVFVFVFGGVRICTAAVFRLSIQPVAGVHSDEVLHHIPTFRSPTVSGRSAAAEPLALPWSHLPTNTHTHADTYSHVIRPIVGKDRTARSITSPTPTSAATNRGFRKLSHQ